MYIVSKMVPGAGLEPARTKRSKDFKSFASTYSAIPASFYGGGTRIRTGDQGFADPRLTTWLCRQ